MSEFDELREVRLEKLKTLSAKKIDSFPAKSHKAYTNKEAELKFTDWSSKVKKITLSGRLMSKREHGGLVFGELRDFSGDFQVLFKQDVLSAKSWNLLGDLIDIGDFLEVKGTLFMTQKNEKTLLVEKFTVLAKSLRPLPEKWHGLVDIETRYRQRYLDLLMNQEIKNRFIVRHKLIQEIRNFLIKQGFIEVDTPALQPLPGGALATPFKTHYDAIDTDVYLRIAPELYLKRLIIGGFEKVFEFARVFRNEGVSPQHLQDFTMLEFYQAYSDYKDLMKLTEKMLSTVIAKVLGTDTIQFGEQTIDLRTPWPQQTLRGAILEKTGIDIDQCSDVASLQLAIQTKNIPMTYTGKTSRGKLIDELYKEAVRPTLINPIFIIDHPVDLSPLAKKQVKDPDKAQRFQLVIAGMEIVNAFSELNDPIDQQARFDQQAQNKASGDIEAHSMDKDYVKALEYGMPPTAGFGMGIDRLVMLLTNTDSIREAVLFPFIKSRE
ncbi:lysine--tRNA ligase [Patescibacteria group bacterium]|nr:lysine--tRNA ligase [Patescibacteria group bacterium]